MKGRSSRRGRRDRASAALAFSLVNFIPNCIFKHGDELASKSTTSLTRDLRNWRKARKGKYRAEALEYWKKEVVRQLRN